MSEVLERKWLEKDGSSFIILREDKSHNPRDYPDQYELLLHDCNRNMHWLFQKNAQGRSKLNKIKAVIAKLEAKLNA